MRLRRLVDYLSGTPSDSANFDLETLSKACNIPRLVDDSKSLSIRRQRSERHTVSRDVSLPRAEKLVTGYRRIDAPLKALSFTYHLELPPHRQAGAWLSNCQTTV